ncbi:hypothetical protein BKA65DRAFT_476898 [Rhexocercosporidium sp. MPI-PUGE-AT-0058]|nr:hypothetical protein BKA65DRAFT_476898 [Rhexocercosporidium sp. MPI-PUGE-AT-0058]
MHLQPQPTAFAVRDREMPYDHVSMITLTSLHPSANPLVLRSDSAYNEEDCTTTSTTPLFIATTFTTSIVAGVNPGCKLTKLSDAVIALGVLCGFFVIGFIVLLICFIRQSNSAPTNSRQGRDRGRTPPCSHPDSPFPSIFQDRPRHFRDDERPRRHRTYEDLRLGGSRDGRLYRRHSMHESPLARSPLARSPLAPPRYMERAPENIPQVQNEGLFPRLPGRNRMFGRTPLAMAGYPFVRNANMNPRAFAQAQGQAGLGLGGVEQMPHPGHIPQPQPQMFPEQQYAEQPGMMGHENLHHRHAQAAIPEMRGTQEQAQQRGSLREEGNVGRSRDPSTSGTAVRNDIFSRMRRDVGGVDELRGVKLRGRGVEEVARSMVDRQDRRRCDVIYCLSAGISNQRKQGIFLFQE